MHVDFVHEQIKQLNADQKVFLLDLFLQLVGSDVPTREETSHLADTFWRAWRAAKDKLERIPPTDDFRSDRKRAQLRMNQTTIDYQYYRVMAQQMGYLEQALFEQASLKLAHEQDLRAIRASVH